MSQNARSVDELSAGSPDDVSRELQKLRDKLIGELNKHHAANAAVVRSAAGVARVARASQTTMRAVVMPGDAPKSAKAATPSDGITARFEALLPAK